MTGISLIKSQAIALFKKRILQTIRSWILLLVQIIIPTGFVIITVLSERTRTRFDNLPSLSLSLDIFLETVSVVQVNPDAVVGGLESRFFIHLLLTKIFLWNWICLDLIKSIKKW